MHEVQPGHLLVPDLRVHADHVAVLEAGDESQRVADGRQQDVAAGLVGLRLDGEAETVAAVDGVLREHVDALAVAVQRRPDILGGIGLGALAAAPEHVGRRAQLGRQVHVAHHLAQRVPAYLPVVAGECAVLEHRVGEQVGGDHRHHQTGLVQRGAEPLDVLVARAAVAAERDQVVVVERDTGSAQRGQSVHGLDRVDRRAGRVTERVSGLPADGPEAEGELVGGGGSQVAHVRCPSVVVGRWGLVGETDVMRRGCGAARAAGRTAVLRRRARLRRPGSSRSRGAA